MSIQKLFQEADCRRLTISKQPNRLGLLTPLFLRWSCIVEPHLDRSHWSTFDALLLWEASLSNCYLEILRNVPFVAGTRSLRFLNDNSSNATSGASKLLKHVLAISIAFYMSSWVVVCSIDHSERRNPTRFVHESIAAGSAN